MLNLVNVLAGQTGLGVCPDSGTAAVCRRSARLEVNEVPACCRIYRPTPYCVVGKWTQNDDSGIMFCALHHSCFAKCWTIDKRLRLRKIVYYWFDDAECDYNNQNMIWTVVSILWSVICQICCTTVACTWFHWWLFKNWTRWWWLSSWTSWQNNWATVINCN